MTETKNSEEDIIEMHDLLQVHPEIRVMGNKIWFTDDVTSSSQQNLINDIMVVSSGLTTQEIRMGLEQNSSAIDIYINSPGGDAHSGLAIYDYLRTFPRIINTHIMGVCASAATMIFLGGDYRYMSENSVMMIHHPRYISQAIITPSANKDMSQNLQLLYDQYRNVYLEYVTCTVEELENIYSREILLNKDKAESLGLLCEEG